VAQLWLDPAAWWQASILNTAGVAWFSSDRTITEYATEIWNAPPQARPGPTAPGEVGGTEA